MEPELYDLGLVVIGRNEGDRLKACLRSAQSAPAYVVYVDSGSTDDSVSIARDANVDIVVLDGATPFTAARARNAGFRHLLDRAPGLRFVQFLDGDCRMEPGWLERARALLEANERVAVSFGLRREVDPERSIFQRVADIEWNIPIGRVEDAAGDVREASSCGGDCLVRVAAFLQVNGFDESLPVCEEPEFCRRLRSAGWRILRLDTPMTRHDSGPLRFGAWAKRVQRTGYGALDYTLRLGWADNPFARQVVSAWVWTVGWLIVLSVSTWILGVWGIILSVMILPLQALRIAVRSRDRAGNGRATLGYGVLTVLGKWFQLSGQIRLIFDRVMGKGARLIEYKGREPVGGAFK